MNRRLHDSMQASERSTSRISRPMDVLVCTIAVFLVACAYYLLLDLRVYGYDEPHYYGDFTFKLKEEGRWINYLLHGFLRSTPLKVDAALFVLMAWRVLYRIAQNVTSIRADAFLLSAVLLVASSFLDQSLWPASLLPALATLLALSLIASEGASYKLVYPLGGLLLFGMLQNYYFLLPLLFLKQLELRRSDARGFVKLLFGHGVYWIGGAILGVLVSLVAVYEITGQVGITPAPWRHAQPIHSFADGLRNIGYVIANLKESAIFFADQGSGRSKLFGLIAFLLFICRLGNWREELARIFILGVIGISFFAFSVPLAPVIQTRSLVNLSIALTIIFLVPFQAKWLSRLLSSLLLAWAGWNMASSAHAALLKEKTETEYALTVMERQLPHAPYGYKAIAVFGEMEPAFPEAAVFNSPPRMVAIAQATGAGGYIDCRPPRGDICEALQKNFELTESGPGERLVYVGTHDNIAVFAFVP